MASNAVDNTMGATLIGVIVAGVLYGVTCVQTFYYFERYRKDAWYIKALVLAVWAFDTVHQALISHTLYFYVITNYHNPEALGNLVWSILLEVLFNGFIGFLVQGFLALRVWRMSGHSVPLMVLIGGLVFAEFACSIAFVERSLRLKTWADLGQLKGLSMTVNVLAAAGDVIIAGALCFFLHFSRTGFKKSNSMITTLIFFSVSTGVLTSICAIGSLISITVWGNTLIYVAFYFSLGRLYSNSLLATLNARLAIRKLGEINDSDDLSFSMNTSLFGHSRTPNDSNRTGISIKIDTNRHSDRDPSTIDGSDTSYSHSQKTQI